MDEHQRFEEVIVLSLAGLDEVNRRLAEVDREKMPDGEWLEMAFVSFPTSHRREMFQKVRGDAIKYEDLPPLGGPFLSSARRSSPEIIAITSTSSRSGWKSGAG